MPVKRGEDARGPFYQWGDKGTRYRYTAGNATSRNAAKDKAAQQGRAIRAGGYRGSYGGSRGSNG